MPTQNTNQIYEAIAAHAAAYAAFAAISDCTDEILAQQHGRKVTQADHDRWERLDLAERKARLALCATPTFGAGQLRSKAAYLLAINTAQLELQDEDYLALLKSLAGSNREFA